jgi:hypothetical protein
MSESELHVHIHAPQAPRISPLEVATRRRRRALERLEDAVARRRRTYDALEDLPNELTPQQVRSNGKEKWGSEWGRSGRGVDRRRDQFQGLAAPLAAAAGMNLAASALEPSERAQEQDDARRHRFRGSSSRRRDDGAEAIELGPVKHGSNEVERLRRFQDYRHRRYSRKLYDAFRSRYPRFADVSDSQVEQSSEFQKSLKAGEFDDLLGLATLSRVQCWLSQRRQIRRSPNRALVPGPLVPRGRHDAPLWPGDRKGPTKQARATRRGPTIVAPAGGGSQAPTAGLPDGLIARSARRCGKSRRTVQRRRLRCPERIPCWYRDVGFRDPVPCWPRRLSQ